MDIKLVVGILIVVLILIILLLYVMFLGDKYEIIKNADFPGGDYKHMETSSVEEAMAICDAMPQCKLFVRVPNKQTYFKSSKGTQQKSDGITYIKN